MENNPFQKVFAINLRRRPERWQRFCDRLPEDWPFAEPERFEAVDGETVTPPSWWNGGRGAWGCYRSHVSVLETCLNEEIDSVLILEDDAVCVDEFGRKVEMFFENLPNDWRMIYLGGQHLELEKRLPRKINDWIYAPYNVNRCHAYGFRNRQAIETAYRHLQEFSDWNALHHVDHRFGELHKKSGNGIYVPEEWLVGQSEGDSDICGDKLGLRFFTDTKDIVEPMTDLPGVAILGNYLCGTNMVAGVLRCLGFSLGKDYKSPVQENMPDFFEDHVLDRILRNCIEEPWMNELLPFEERVSHLRRWAGIQCKYKTPGMTHYVAKHPILSVMGPELMKAWNDPRFIVVDRNDDFDPMRIDNVNWRWHERAVQYIQKSMKKEREYFLETFQPKLLRLHYEAVKKEPEEAVRKISLFLGHTASEERMTKAVKLVEWCENDLCYIQ